MASIKNKEYIKALDKLIDYWRGELIMAPQNDKLEIAKCSAYVDAFKTAKTLANKDR